MARREVEVKGTFFRVEGVPNTFFVPSDTQEGKGYLVRLTPFPACTCPGFRYNGHCKHLAKIQREVLGEEHGPSEISRESTGTGVR